MNFTINSYIKYVSKKNLLLPGIVAVITAILLIALPLKYEFNPPKTSSNEEIKALSKKKIGFTDFTLENLHYSNYDYYTGNKKVSACYYYVLDEGVHPSCTFILIPIENTQNKSETLATYTAKAKIIKGDKRFEKFIESFASDIGWNSSDLKNICGGYVVSEYDYHPGLTIFITILLILLLAISVVYFLANLVFMFKPHLHPSCKRLHKYGLARRDFKEIDYELSNYLLFKAGNMYVTENYLVIFGKRNLWMVPLYNIVWAYQFAIWNPFVNKSKLNYNLTIITSPKTYVLVRGNKKANTDKVLAFLKNNFTHISIGYSEKIKKSLKGLI